MKKGFTLIEVLVVVAIVGILTTIVFKSIGPNIPKDSQGTLGQLVAEANYPDPTNYAVDAAGVLTPDQLNNLNAKLKTMDSDKHQFGVAIINSTSPLEIEQYGIKLAEKWKVGKKGLDNGAIIIIAVKDRKVRIEVGYGLEGDVPDAVAGRIINDDMVPLLKKGDWYGAAVAGLDALNSKIQ